MSSPRKVTFGRVMVVTQVALSLALLASAGMLLRSFDNLLRTDVGFQREHVLLFKVASESSDTNRTNGWPRSTTVSGRNWTRSRA